MLPSRRTALAESATRQRRKTQVVDERAPRATPVPSGGQIVAQPELYRTSDKGPATFPHNRQDSPIHYRPPSEQVIRSLGSPGMCANPFDKVRGEKSSDGKRSSAIKLTLFAPQLKAGGWRCGPRSAREARRRRGCIRDPAREDRQRPRTHGPSSRHRRLSSRTPRSRPRSGAGHAAR